MKLLIDPAYWKIDAAFGGYPHRLHYALKANSILAMRLLGHPDDHPLVVGVHDLELVPLPLTRFTVRGEQAAGGISVRTSPSDPEVVEIRLFDADGADLSAGAQRKVERTFFREDYRRAAPSRIGELVFPPRALERHTAGLVRSVRIEAIRKAAPKGVSAVV